MWQKIGLRQRRCRAWKSPACRLAMWVRLFQSLVGLSCSGPQTRRVHSKRPADEAPAKTLVPAPADSPGVSPLLLGTLPRNGIIQHLVPDAEHPKRGSKWARWVNISSFCPRGSGTTCLEKQAGLSLSLGVHRSPLPMGSSRHLWPDGWSSGHSLQVAAIKG